MSHLTYDIVEFEFFTSPSSGLINSRSKKERLHGKERRRHHRLKIDVLFAVIGLDKKPPPVNGVFPRTIQIVFLSMLTQWITSRSRASSAQ